MMNKMIKKVAIVIAAATMAIAGTTIAASAAPCNKQAVVTASELAVRTAPGTGSKQVGSLYRGEGVTIIDTDDFGGWTKIGYNGGERFVCSQYISTYNQGQTYTGSTDDHGFKADSNVATKQTYTVSVAPGTYLALRNDFSSSDASIVDELYNGQTVTVIEGNGKFWLVSSDKDGRMGYVNSNYLF